MKTPYRLVVVAAIVAAASVVSKAQRQEAVFRAETNYVEIVASVTDRQGNFVKGLTIDDFEVKEQGRRETLDNFSYVELPAPGESSNSRPAAFHSGVPKDQREADGRLFLIYLAGTSAGNVSQLRTVAKEFVRNHLQEGDRAAVWDSQFPLRDAQFTDSKASLVAAIEPYTGVGPTELPFSFRCRPGASWQPGEAGLQEQCNAALAKPHLELLRAIDWFNNVQGRRKSIVLFAGGWEGDTDPVSYADITLYAVDIRGLVAPDFSKQAMGAFPTDGSPGSGVTSNLRALSDSVEGLHLLANRTGGFALINGNSFDDGFRRIIDANSRYYVLGYASSYKRNDRVFRQLDVKVKRPGLKVHARRGYFPKQ